MFEIRKHEKLEIYNTLSYFVCLSFQIFPFDRHDQKKNLPKLVHIAQMYKELLFLSDFIRFARFMFEHFIIWFKTHFLITK